MPRLSPIPRGAKIAGMRSGVRRLISTLPDTSVPVARRVLRHVSGPDSRYQAVTARERFPNEHSNTIRLNAVVPVANFSPVYRATAGHAITPSAEPTDSSTQAPRMGPRNTVSHALPYRCGTP
jgi:hypothetical protein